MTVCLLQRGDIRTRFDKAIRYAPRHSGRERMTRETIYLVQSFIETRGSLRAEPATRCKSEEAAKRAAALLGETKAGAIAFSSSGDADLGDFDDDPVILATFGRVPESFAS